MRVSHNTLKVLAATVWVTGGAVLLWFGAERLLEAATLLHTPAWPLLAGALGLVAGVFRGRLVFRRAAERNIRRIQCLETPRIWQFFRPAFFLALAAMIAAAVGLSLLAEAGAAARVVVGGLDWAIAFSLLVSARVFRIRGEAAVGNPDRARPARESAPAGAEESVA